MGEGMSDWQRADQSDDQTEAQVQKSTDNQRAIAALERTLIEAFSDPEARADILGWIAEDVRRAHGVRPASWSLTLRPTGELSLNVGRLQVLGIGPKQVRYVKMEPERSGETVSVPEVTQEPFSSLPGARLLSAPPGAFRLFFRGEVATHQQLVEQAAAETARTPFFIHHSAPALAWLEEQVGGALPRPVYGDEAPSLSESFVWYFQRFVEEFLWQEIGRQHMAWYEDHRARGLENYRQLLAARERGEDVTDAVLLKLLPYKNSEANRTAGAWTHLAPAINGNVKLWFENKGWAQPSEWPAKALRLLAFFESCEKAPDEFEAICSEYASDPLSKGFSAGMLSPLLNAIDPVRFRLTNAKPRKVVGWQLDQSFDQRLTSFAALNAAIAELTSAFSGEMHSISESDAPPADLFDAFCHWFVAESGVPVPPPLPGLPQIQPRFWKIAPGEDAWQWAECRDGGFIALGWDELGDLSELSEEELQGHLEELRPAHPDWGAQGPEQAWQFSRIRTGDRIVANQGTTKVLGIGTVTGPYYFESGARQSHRLPVRWDDTTPRTVEQGGWRRTLIELTAEQFEAIMKPPADAGAGTPASPRRVSLAECAARTGIAEATLSRWLRALERKGQAIFYGPPGTGKTFVAEHLADHLVSRGNGFKEVLQFHPAYAYEDFIQGIRPRLAEGGGLTYEIEAGSFLRFCTRAAELGPDDLCVLILDEINRANLARVFGELMYLLEYRDRKMPLAAGGWLQVPGNVRILGTMNTADRSIALVDHALRRRFAFLELRPDFELLRRKLAGQQDAVDVDALIRLLEQVNQTIGDPHYEVGISFFLRERLDTHLEDIWRMEILPYLDECFFDNPSRVEPFAWERIAGRLLRGE